MKLQALDEQEGVESMLKEIALHQPTFRMQDAMEELIQKRMEQTGEDQETAAKVLEQDEAANQEVKERTGLSQAVFEAEMKQLRVKVDQVLEKQDQIYAVVMRDKLEALERALVPLSFERDLAEYGARFVDGTRGWVFNEVEKWRQQLGGKEGGRCRVLLGGPGFGKTAIVAQLVARQREAVLGVHLCRHSDQLKRDPRQMIASLAYQLAQALPEFRAKLEAPQVISRLSQKAELEVAALFGLLLVEPLHGIEPPPLHEGGRYLLVIDALDEAEYDLKNDLLKLIAREFDKLPPWLGVLVTSRPEVHIKEMLKKLQPTELDAEKHAKECDEDVGVYLDKVLRDVVPATELASAVATVARKAQRVFLYLHYLRNRIEEKGTLDVDALPEGLAEEYVMKFERLFPKGLPEEGKERRVLQAIVAAAIPPCLSKDNPELPLMSGVAYKECKRVVSELSQLFPVRDDERVHVFHKSVTDWLTGSPPYDDRDEDSPFFVDRAAGQQMVAKACAEAPRSGYANRWALHHCAEAADWGAFACLATDLGYLEARFAAGSGATLGLELGRARGAACAAQVAPFGRFVISCMHILMHEPTAVSQLACQQPKDCAVFKVWEAQTSPGRCVLWHNKPEAEDPCLLTIQCNASVQGFGQIDGDRFVVGAGKNVQVRDGRNGELIEAFESDTDVISVAVNTAHFCAGYANGTIKVWDSGARFSDIPKFEPLLTVSASQRSHSESADREDERPQRLDPVGGVFTGWEADRVRI